MKHKQKGFTLIELIVVVAIIGLLASIVLASLGSARKNARIAAAQGSMRNLTTAMVLCLDEGNTFNLPTESNTGGSDVVCSTVSGGTATAVISKYAALPGDWIYCDADTTGTTVCGATVSQKTTAPFMLAAKSTLDATTISCTENGCVKS